MASQQYYGGGPPQGGYGPPQGGYPQQPQQAYYGPPQGGYQQGPPMQYQQGPPMMQQPQKQSGGGGCFKACIATLCCCFVCEEGCECLELCC